MKKKLFIGFVSVALTTLAVLGVWISNGLSSLEQASALDQPVLFTVERGSSYRAVAHQLEDLGVVEDARWLRLRARLQGEGGSLKSGTYEITPGMSPLDVVAMIAAGRTKSWPVQLIEGWTFADVRAELARHDHLEHTIQDMDNAAVMAALGEPDKHPEGLFFPDTYRYEANETDLGVLKRARDRMKTVLEEEWQQRSEGLPYEEPYQALIMASLIEKETGVVSERPTIAGVFVRRLAKGMRLQTDPTVIYGLGSRYLGNLTREHLREDTPYNTYRRNGLPPTPIALAGREAINAALHPADGEALYFVAKGDGSHAFSKTLAEHRAAVQEYQIKMRRKDYRSSPTPGEE